MGEDFLIKEDPDSNEIINNETNRNIIIEDGIKAVYLESKITNIITSSSDLVIYARSSNQFSKKSYNLNASFTKTLTIDDLQKIFKVFYSIFKYGHNVPAFGINQERYCWSGYGHLNFIKALEMQDQRYKKLQNSNAYIHHREIACFIDEMESALFYIQMQPNTKNQITDPITMDYVNIGFVFNNIPYDRIFYEFFEKINNIPQFITELDVNFIDKDINYKFNDKGYIVNKYSTKDEDLICGVYGDNSRGLYIGNTHCNRIVVNFSQHHPLSNKHEYKIIRATCTTLPFDGFQVQIVNYKGEWKRDR